MPKSVVLLSIPGLRSRDLGAMPRLLDLSRKGVSVPLTHSFPAVTAPVQATLTTGVGPERHGVVANSLYLRDKGEVETWPAWGEMVQAPPIWETLKQRDATITSALWFPALAKRANADLVCMLTTDNADLDRSRTCDTRPPELSAALQDSLGPFPGAQPRGARLKQAAWIVDSFVQSAYVARPRFSYVALSHLEMAALKFGPDSTEVLTAVAELDMAIGALVDGFAAAGIKDVTWLVASEYCIGPVTSVGSPNRTLREAGLLTPVASDGVEHLALRDAKAFALVDHQLAHVYVRDHADIASVAAALRGDPAVDQVLVGEARAAVGLNHERSGEIVLLARPESWFAYDWWLDDADAPRVVPAHQKLGWDPVELLRNEQDSGRWPDATLIKGAHGLVTTEASRGGILVSSESHPWLAGRESGVRDTDVSRLVFELFGLG
ncbi:MAG TPA: alkaline phosphatase family protein [Caulifigura sp.]|nr:alkaline phosphatase family protein [Caulifigura sp.]